MRQTTLRPEFVEFIPETLDDGVIYIGQRYMSATHLGCCDRNQSRPISGLATAEQTVISLGHLQLLPFDQ